MPLERDWLATHLPHRGRMCLLARVLDWDDERIRCLCTGHRDPEHPLRNAGRLGVAAGIELASQAMAAHAALSAASAEDEGRPRLGLLAALRSVRFGVLRLDDLTEDIVCGACRVAGDGATALYEFSLMAAQRCLIEGRATVLLDASAAPR